MKTFREYLAEAELNEKLEVDDVLDESISTQKLNSKTVEKLFNSNKVNEEFID